MGCVLSLPPPLPLYSSFSFYLWQYTDDDTSRQENGVDTAIQSIYRDLEYATQLINTKTGKNRTRRAAATSAAANATATVAGTATDGSGSNADLLLDDEEDEEEESWTFVGGDAETIDDLSVEGTMKRTTVPDLRRAAPPVVGTRVAGGAPGAGLGLGL